MTWDQVGKSAGGQDYLKVESGQTVKVHVMSEEPHSYKSVFFNSINRSAVVTDETAGLIENPKDIRPQHAFVVVLEDGSVKIWLMGNRLAEAVKNVYDTYGGLGEVDLVIKRTGVDKATKWGVTPVPAAIDTSAVDPSALPNLEEVIAPTSEEDIEKMKAGIDPSTEFNPAEIEGVNAGSGESEGEKPAEEVEAPALKPAVKPQPKMSAGADPRAAVVREIMLLLSKSKKYATLPARQALMKRIAPGKTVVGALLLPELLKMRNELKK